MRLSITHSGLDIRSTNAYKNIICLSCNNFYNLMHFHLDEEKSVIVSSKFIVYDSDENGVLNRFEEFKFHDELGKLFGCKSFFTYLNEMMDGNTDHQISPEEWNTFFGVVTAPGMLIK